MVRKNLAKAMVKNSSDDEFLHIHEILPESNVMSTPGDGPWSTMPPVNVSLELETSFLHPSSLVFTVIAQLRQNLVPAIIALVRSRSKETTRLSSQLPPPFSCAFNRRSNRSAI